MQKENGPVAEVLAGQSKIKDWQEQLYRTLHQYPELGHQEVQTADKVAEELRNDGFEVHDQIGSTGVVGVLQNGAGPVVLMRADMDALPVEEATDLPYASTERTQDQDGNEVPLMHACGHDVHVSCLLGAARLLSQQTDSWSGTYIALFQPAEELANGAQTMVDGGLAKLIPKPDVALGQHVMALPAGQVGTRPGPFLSSGDSMRVTVWGRGSHGSMPQQSVDPVVLASSIVMRLQTIVSREVTPGEFAVLTIGSIRAGSTSNIISDRAVLELNIRTFSEATRHTILNAIRRIVEAECQASGSPKSPTFELYNQYPLTDNDTEMTSTVAEAFTTYFGEDAIAAGQQSASEDFSHIPEALGVPYTYWIIGGIDPEAYAKAAEAGTLSSDIPANHSPSFAPVIDPTLETGTATAVVAAMAWLGKDGNA